MIDTGNFRPAPEIADALAFALHYRGRKRVKLAEAIIRSHDLLATVRVGCGNAGTSGLMASGCRCDMSGSNCPICGGDAAALPDGVAARYHCSRCGNLRIGDRGVALIK